MPQPAVPRGFPLTTPLIVALLFSFAPSPRLACAEDPAPQAGAALPEDAVLEKDGAVIGEVTIRPRNIFDPDEDPHYFLFANRLHRTTRSGVIASHLLFKNGDRYSRRILDESERALRSERYLYEAEIRPVRYDGHRVDVEVTTRDVWTLNAGVGLGRSGGANSTRFELQDTNLFGTGKGLTLERATDVDRTTSLLRYDDHAVLGSRVQLGLSYSENSDGGLRRLDLGRPFYSLDSHWSAGLAASSDDRVDSLYTLGHISGQLRHQQDLFEIRGGLSRGLVDGRARRWSTGFTFLRDRFETAPPAAGQAFGAGASPPRPDLPPDRTLSYPWIGFNLIEDRFQEAQDLDQIHRTEDLQLGRQLHLQLGWSSPLFGGDRNLSVFDSNASLGWKPREDQTLLVSSGLSGRWGSGGAEGLRLDGSARYYWRDFGEHLLFITLEGAAVENPDPETQLLLGGDNGLRGYPLRYQDGDRRALLTIEQRFFSDFYPFHLVHVGAAAFFDAGRTWGPSLDPAARNLGLLKDVGVGLRLGASRSGLGQITHLDIAFPLDGDGSIHNLQWLVTTKAGF